MCSLAADAGPCQRSLVRWYYSAADGRCHEFVYGGCEGNSNRFTTQEQCVERCGSDDQVHLSDKDSTRLRKDPGTHLTLPPTGLLLYKSLFARVYTVGNVAYVDLKAKTVYNLLLSG